MTLRLEPARPTHRRPFDVVRSYRWHKLATATAALVQCGFLFDLIAFFEG